MIVTGGGNLNKRVGGDLPVITKHGPSWRDDRPRRTRLKFTAHAPRVTLLSAPLTPDPGYNQRVITTYGSMNINPTDLSLLADYF